MNFRGTRREDPEINLIPMIDVLLVILIFVMVTTTYSKYAELQINLPTADAEKQSDRPNEINITVSAAGQYTIDRKPVSFASVGAFGEAMRAAAASRPDRVIKPTPPRITSR
jgi:biopolymer transport protein ExbD